MITADHISYKVRGSALLDNVSALMQPDRLTVVLGPNGAGKSTFIKALSGEISVQSGVVSIADVDLKAWNQQRLATRRAVVTQFNQIEFPFTVAEVIMLGMMPIKKLKKIDHAEGIAEEVMRELDLLALLDRQYATLSGGEQQRVAIARALVQVAVEAKANQHCYLLLDEPTASLDIQYQHELLKILKRYLLSGFTIVMVLHDINLALQYADNVILLKHGCVVKSGNINQVLDEKIIEEVFSIKGEFHKTRAENQRFFMIN